MAGGVRVPGGGRGAGGGPAGGRRVQGRRRARSPPHRVWGAGRVEGSGPRPERVRDRLAGRRLVPRARGYVGDRAGVGALKG
ncbi:MAG TPA: hypothetical protein ENK57_01710 [Polyangiaceae bacterium]|nr:hypothetical protein [Polyangiaceae bacterium]